MERKEKPSVPKGRSEYKWGSASATTHHTLRERALILVLNILDILDKKVNYLS